MIHLKVYEAKTFYEGPEEELDRMFEVLRIKDKNARFKARFVLKKLGYLYIPKERLNEEQAEKIEQITSNAEYVHFYDKRRKNFGTGFLRSVKEHLAACEIGFDIADRRNTRVRFDEISDCRFVFEDDVEVRDEQLLALRASLKKGSGILHLATNAGKTEIAAMIISAWMLKQQRIPRVLFLIHRASLAKQTQKRFQKHLGVNVACVGAGEYQLHRITVATTQTSANLVDENSATYLEFLNKCDIVFVDELHVNKAKQVEKTMDRCRARMRFGLSGTIDEKTTAKMMRYIGMIGPIISNVRNKELVELGRSAKPTIRMVWISTHQVSGSFAKSYRKAIIENGHRNRIVVKEALKYVDRGFRTMITVARIDHGRHLMDLVQHYCDLRVEFMHGSTPLSVREKLKRKFVRGKIPILIASPIFDVGEDLPEIDAWVNAAGGKGWELVLQRLGRTLRRKEGENKVRITDFMDTHNNYMLRHSVRRLEYYVREKIAKIKIIR